MGRTLSAGASRPRLLGASMPARKLPRIGWRRHLEPRLLIGGPPERGALSCFPSSTLDSTVSREAAKIARHFAFSWRHDAWANVLTQDARIEVIWSSRCKSRVPARRSKRGRPSWGFIEVSSNA